MSERSVPRRDIPDKLRIRPGSRPKLTDAEADRCYGWEKDKASAATAENLARLEELQYKMYADGRFAMLVIPWDLETPWVETEQITMGRGER